MKIRNSSYLALLAFAAVLIFSSCGSTPNSIIVTVNFGFTPKGGGPCSGKGLCNSIAPASKEEGAPGIQATFTPSSTDKSVVLMSFSLAELQKKQPEQAANFKDGSTYNFDGPYEFNDKLFTPLKLAARARIDEKAENKVEIKGDVVTVALHYAHE